MTKTQLIAQIAKDSSTATAPITQAMAKSVLDSLAKITIQGLKDTGLAVVPGLVRIKARETEATKDRQGINPFTKQPMTIKGKPASKKVRATAIKDLKDALA